MTESFVRKYTRLDAWIMLSPGQDGQSNTYSHGNIVLQGAPCGQCRDLCPAGYVPHFWRKNEKKEKTKFYSYNALSVQVKSIMFHANCCFCVLPTEQSYHYPPKCFQKKCMMARSMATRICLCNID
ncbi:PREDICTED: uncharacterized protein LOC108545852 [Eufriesea mexicana]|uniref:uncharacterized protein LOC108545852 n=1 Tax=Eufriesea mexicana TaxID=516756 RepID=UPI00083C072A|nr:PREDICTED: uncharacterized protein LOC108545852 [Eufriesea mexicana]